MFDRVDYRMFRGLLSTWEELFRQAAEFASTLRPEQLISISHSEDGNDGVVAVWYWASDELSGDADSEPLAPGG